MQLDSIKIYGEKVILRPMEARDAAYIVRWRNDPDIKKWMFNQKELTLEGHLEWFKNVDISKRIDYVICDIKNGTPIGTVNFKNINESRAEEGKMLGDKSYWGGGFAKESFLLWLNFGFQKLELKEIYIRTFINNIPNIKLNEKIGFIKKEEGVIEVDSVAKRYIVMKLKNEDFYLKNII
ncbi:GNAT family N-acetyltransferase [Marinilabiliaceae bacterium ANBcel2]|nr:GNAT family N-acetyltransferase [Marinilabiliaceae bacterium ANBcel2]